MHSANFILMGGLSLLFIVCAGIGRSLAWKINFWARLGDGNHAFQLSVDKDHRPAGTMKG